MAALFRRLLRVQKYPRYVVDLYCRYLLPVVTAKRGCHIDRGVLFMGIPIISLAPKSRIDIGHDAVLCSRSDDTALGVNHPIVLRTLRRGALLSIGAGVRMSGTTICAATCVRVGDRTCMGANVTIADTDFHSLDPEIRSSPADADSATSLPVEIGADVFLGTGVIVMKGVTIGSAAVVGSGSVVTKNIPEFAIAAGNPAKVIGDIRTKRAIPSIT